MELEYTKGSSVPDPFWISNKICMHRSAQLYLLSRLLVYENIVPIPERGGGEGGEGSRKFYTRRLCTKVHTLTLFYTIFDRKVIFGFHTKWYPLHNYQRNALDIFFNSIYSSCFERPF